MLLKFAFVYVHYIRFNKFIKVTKAIFIHSGQLTLSKTTFVDNKAIGGTGISLGQGKGGAIFVVTNTLKQSADVKRTPLVATLKSFPEFSNNFATDARNSSTDNDNVYGEISIH